MASQGVVLQLPLVRSNLMSVTVPVALALLLLGVSLSMDRLPLPAVRSVAPAAGVVCIAALPLVMRKVRWTPLTTAVAVFAGYAVVHSVALLAYDTVTGAEDRDRAITWGRQVAALTVGIITFLVMRSAFARANGRDLGKWLLLGAAPALVMGVVQIAAWVLHMDAATDAVVWVRTTVLGLHPMPGRVSGLAVEPASYAGYAAAAVIPLAGAAVFVTGRPRFASVVLAVAAVSLIFTFSGIGYSMIAAVCIAFVALMPGRYRLITAVAAAIFVGGVVTVLQTNPNSYLLNVIDEHVAAAEQAGEEGTLEKFTSLTSSGVGTIATKVGSTVDPITHMGSSRVAFGYGLGGTESHAAEFLSEKTLEAFYAVSSGFAPTLKTLAGRIIAELGVIGTILAVVVLAVALRSAGTLLRELQVTGAAETVPVIAARVGLVVCAIGMLISLGSFALPYIWLWLAVIDSRELKLRDAHGAPEGANRAASDRR
jgi:hypothetical protein